MNDQLDAFLKEVLTDEGFLFLAAQEFDIVNKKFKVPIHATYCFQDFIRRLREKRKVHEYWKRWDSPLHVAGTGMVSQVTFRDLLLLRILSLYIGQGKVSASLMVYKVNIPLLKRTFGLLGFDLLITTNNVQKFGYNDGATVRCKVRILSKTGPEVKID